MKSAPVFLLLAACSCDVPEPPRDSGGIEPPPLEGAHPDCGRGLVVINTDYQSTTVSLLDRTGEVLSPSFIASSSTRPGLSLPLGGDVVLPTERAEDGEIVLIDRHPAAVLSWVDLRTAAVRAQLSVATGFSSNPHDVVTLAGETWVTRFELNQDAGRMAFDQGSDILVVDRAVAAIVGRIDVGAALAGEPREYSPGPDRALHVGSAVYVLLGGYLGDFTASVASRLVKIDASARALVSVLTLDGFHGCGGLALSQDETELGVVCSGEYHGSSTPAVDSSGIVIVGLGADPSIVRRYSARELGGQPLSPVGAFAETHRFLYVALGRYAGADGAFQDDVFGELDLETGDHRELLRSENTPFTLGEVRCLGDCGLCFVTDAGRAKLHRYRLIDGHLGHDGTITVDDRSGLPPRGLGAF